MALLAYITILQPYIEALLAYIEALYTGKKAGKSLILRELSEKSPKRRQMKLTVI